MEFVSTQKYLIFSPRKLREVARMIKKLTPSDALNKIPFISKRAALPLSKVVKSAIANAMQRGIHASELVFKSIQINDGPRLKRFRAGARGRAKPYKRRMSHIKVVLVSKPKSQIVESKEVKTAVKGNGKDTKQNKISESKKKNLRGKILNSKKEK